MVKELIPAELPGLSAQTFEFGKRVFISGLFWQPLPGSTARLRKAEIQKMSEEQGFDLAVLRTSGIPQVGFASLSDGARPGMLSVAAMVSKSLEVANRERSFLCAMPVPGGQWLYVAQREGVLLHDGDLLGSEDLVRARMMTDLSLTEWQTIFAPANWGIPDAMQRPFEELLPKSGEKYSFKKWWEVRPIRNTWFDYVQEKIALLGVFIVVAVCLLGYYAWNQYRISENLKELAQLEAAEQAARQTAAAEQPWKKQPRAEKFVAACNQAIGQVNTFWPGGWTVNDAVCKDHTLTVSWTRKETGRLEHLLAVQPNVEISINGNMATLNIPFELPGGENDALPTERDRMVALYGAAQSYGLSFTLKNSSNATPILGQPSAVAGDWKTLDWTVTDMNLAPSTIIPLLDSGGFRLHLIRLSFGGGIMKWNMEGTQYVQK